MHTITSKPTSVTREPTNGSIHRCPRLLRRRTSFQSAYDGRRIAIIQQASPGSGHATLRPAKGASPLQPCASCFACDVRDEAHARSGDGSREQFLIGRLAHLCVQFQGPAIHAVRAHGKDYLPIRRTPQTAWPQPCHARVNAAVSCVRGYMYELSRWHSSLGDGQGEQQISWL